MVQQDPRLYQPQEVIPPQHLYAPEISQIEEGNLKTPIQKKRWSTKKKICCFGCLPFWLAVIIVVGVLAALILTRPYPSVTNYGTEMGAFGVNEARTAATMNITVYLGVHNTEFVPITLRSLDLDIYYKDTTQVGTIAQSDLTFPANSFTNWTIPVSVYVSDASTALGMIDDYENKDLVLTFEGPVKIGVFGIYITRNLDFSETFGGTVNTNGLSQYAREVEIQAEAIVV